MCVRLLLLLCCVAAPLTVLSCSDFIMDNAYRLSVRTMDVGDGYTFALQTSPRGTPIPEMHTTATYGAVVSVGVNVTGKYTADSPVTFAGLNEKGLSCDFHTLLNSSYPPPSNTSADLNLMYFCNWALSSFATAGEVKTALRSGHVHLWGTPTGGADGVHFIVRDSQGQGIAVEFMQRETKVYEDNNDSGETGYGVFTNEPEYPWQVANVKHYRWKQSMARPATTIPGAYYPDERFLRIHLLKSAMPNPQSYQEAMQQALHVLNTVTVPMGMQPGTDSGFGEGNADHTHYGHIYDHKQQTLYWRHQSNLQLERIRLQDLKLAQGSPVQVLPYKNNLPWFNDATHAFK